MTTLFRYVGPRPFASRASPPCEHAHRLAGGARPLAPRAKRPVSRSEHAHAGSCVAFGQGALPIVGATGVETKSVNGPILPIRLPGIEGMRLPDDAHEAAVDVEHSRSRSFPRFASGRRLLGCRGTQDVDLASATAWGYRLGDVARGLSGIGPRARR